MAGVLFMVLIDLYVFYREKKLIVPKNPKNKCCPICGNDTFIDYCYTLMICSKCKGLIDYTPFGLKITSNDASIRFPEINEWWDKRFEMDRCKIGGDNYIV